VTADLPVGEAGHAIRPTGRGTTVAKRQLMNQSLSLGKLWLLSFVLAGASIGCATPGPLVTLAPANAAVVWVAGRASVSKENAGVRVAAAFEHQDGDTLGLRVEIENATENPIELDPRNISFNVCETQNRETCAPAERAIDPEVVLADLAHAKARNEADAVNDQALLGTLALLSLATDVAAIGSGHADRHTGQLTQALASDMAVDEVRHDSRRAGLSTQQQLWSDVALRRNTIGPGRAVGGRVFIPIYLKAHRVWLHVQIAGRVFSFPFEQTVVQTVTAG
jgi:hypothetical protein